MEEEKKGDKTNDGQKRSSSVSQTTTPSSSATIGLTPSQAMRSSSSGSINLQNNKNENIATKKALKIPQMNDEDKTMSTKQDNNNNINNKNKNQRRGRGRRRGGTNDGNKQVPKANKAAVATITANEGDVNVPSISADQSSNATKQKRRQPQGKRGTNEEDQGKKPPAAQSPRSTGQGRNRSNNNRKKSSNNNNITRKPKKKYPWRRYIPKGTVDPITLENLQTLEYPPFALCADEPYFPIPEWPILPEVGANAEEGTVNRTPSAAGGMKKKVVSQVDLEELNRKRLAEQWGASLLPLGGESKSDDESNKRKPPMLAKKVTSPIGNHELKQQGLTEPPIPLSKRPYNLFDGRALAYYMVSQLQFIDPLNRRDLTRPELLNLDEYLVRHGLFTGDLKVTEAYDAKGITLSSAGAAASTAQGRADIMQQMAQQLLNSLFVGQSVTSRRPDTSSMQPQSDSFSLQEQYAALQRQEQEWAQQRHVAVSSVASRRYDHDNLFGSMDNDGGFMVIDDDENPEMRGRNDFPSLSDVAGRTSVPVNGNHRSAPLYSASHISDRYAADGFRNSGAPTGVAFPALPTPVAPTSISSATTADSSSNTYKKPPPKASKTLAKISGLVKKTDPEEKQRQWEAREAARKRAMMSNLSYGMNPSMGDMSSSSTRLPHESVGSANIVTEDKLERNRAFAEALGVKPATQRHLSTGWARPTEGKISLDEFGNELNAAFYPDTLVAIARERMPLLLKLEKKRKTFLDDDKAASLPLNPMDKPSRAFVHQYAEFWRLKTESFDPEPKRYIHCVKLPETSMPHPLLSDATRNWRGPLLGVSKADYTDHTTQQTAGQSSKSRDLPPSDRGAILFPDRPLSPLANEPSRFDSLMEKERPKLELAPRTVPLELAPYEQQHFEDVSYDAAEDLKKRQARHEEQRRRKQEAEKKKQRVLEKAFASDSEEDSLEDTKNDDSESEWGEEPEAVYTGSDDEE